METWVMLGLCIFYWTPNNVNALFYQIYQFCTILKSWSMMKLEGFFCNESYFSLLLLLLCQKPVYQAKPNNKYLNIVFTSCQNAFQTGSNSRQTKSIKIKKPPYTVKHLNILNLKPKIAYIKINNGKNLLDCPHSTTFTSLQFDKL